MLKTKLSILIVLGMMLIPSLMTAKTVQFERNLASEQTLVLENPSELDQQTLRQVLLMVKEHHPEYNYGTLRSRYEQGRLVIIKTVSPSTVDLYTVLMDGIEICVLMPI